MKTLLLLLVLIRFAPIVKAQARVNDGQYTSPVSFNWVDSAAKYWELSRFYISEDGHTADFLKFNTKFDFYQAKLDSLSAVERRKKWLQEKQKLESKYKMKLP